MSVRPPDPLGTSDCLRTPSMTTLGVLQYSSDVLLGSLNDGLSLLDLLPLSF
jgi:hypothetical protein